MTDPNEDVKSWTSSIQKILELAEYLAARDDHAAIPTEIERDKDPVMRETAELLTAAGRLGRLTRDVIEALPQGTGIASLDPQSFRHDLRVVVDLTKNIHIRPDPRREDSNDERLSQLRLLAESIIRIVRIFRHYAENFYPAGERRGSLLARLDSLESSVESRALVLETLATRNEAVRVLTETKQAAGQTATLALSEHFGNFARQERRSANTLRLLATFNLVGISLIAGYLILANPGETATIAGELTRIVIILPLAVLAGYFGRESSRHRATANWASELEVQLMTLEAFIAPLDEDEQRLYRSSLGARVFSAHLPAESRTETSPNLLSETASLLEAIASITRVGGDESGNKK